MKVLILTATDPNKSKVSGGVRTFNLYMSIEKSSVMQFKSRQLLI